MYVRRVTGCTNESCRFLDFARNDKSISTIQVECSHARTYVNVRAGLAPAKRLKSYYFIVGAGVNPPFASYCAFIRQARHRSLNRSLQRSYSKQGWCKSDVEAIALMRYLGSSHRALRSEWEDLAHD